MQMIWRASTCSVMSDQRSTLQKAVFLSLVAHGLLALTWQTATLLDVMGLSRTPDAIIQTQPLNTLMIEAPRAAIAPSGFKSNTLNNDLSNGLSDSAYSHQAPSQGDTQAQPKTEQHAPLVPIAPESADITTTATAGLTPNTTPLTPPESIALPHEELARKIELPPVSANNGKEKATQFSVPNKVRLRYEGFFGGTPVQGVLNYQVKNDDYLADLTLSASLFFKKIEIKNTVNGVLDAQGLSPLYAQDKAMNGRLTAVTIEPHKARVIISSQDGFLPYTAEGKDWLSLILQLGIFIQAQPEWVKKGSAHDFTVYRPSGIKRWRYQSQGVEFVQIAAQRVEAVYIKRVPLNAEPDYEYIHHLWLDPARHGLPLRIKLEDTKSGRTIDLTLAQWDEL